MKYPCINEKQIEETLKFYNENPDIDSPVINVMGRTLTEYIDNMNKRAKKDTNGKLEKSLIIYRENKDLLTDQAIEVVNKLLGDRKIRNKIRLVNDGSYLVNRIWGHVRIRDGKIDMQPEFDGYYIGIDTSKFNNLSIKKKIDWIYNHFDLIYVQIPFVDNLKDILNLIECELIQDVFDKRFLHEFNYY